MKRVSGKSNSNVLWLLYLVFLILILVLWFLSFFIVNTIYKNQILETMNTTLNQGHSVFSEKITTFERDSLYTLMQPDMIKYMHTSTPVTEGTNFQLLKKIKDLYEHDKSSSNPTGIYVAYFNQPNTFVSLYGASTRSLYYYNYYMKYEGMSFDEWLDLIDGQMTSISFWPTADINIKGKTGQYVSVIYKMEDFSYSSVSYSVLCSMIPVESLRDYYQGVLDIDTGCVFLADQQDQIFYYSGPEDEYAESRELLEAFVKADQDVQIVGKSGNRMILMRQKSTGRFNSYALVDYSVINDQISPLNIMFLSTFIFTLGIGILIVIRSYFLYSKPIKKISQLLHDYYSIDNKDPYNLSSIHTSLDKIIHINQEMVTQVDQTQAFLQDAFIKHLFLSEFDDNTELMKTANQVNIALPAGKYFVAIFRFRANLVDVPEDNTILQVVHLALEKSISQLMPPPVFQYNEGIHCIAALFTIKSANDLNAFVQKHFGELTSINIEGAMISLAIGISAVFDDLIDTASAKRQAIFALDCSNDDDHIKYFGDLQQYKSFYYPNEREKALVSMIRKGNQDEAISIMKGLFVHNYVTNTIPEIMKQQFLYSICNTLLNLIDEQPQDQSNILYSIHLKLLSMHPPMNMTEQIDQLSQMIELLCQMQKKRSAEAPDYVDSILAYINQNCTQSDFSLQNVADNFHLSAAYVSRQIHQRTNLTFSFLVEHARMEMARDYVMNTNETVNAIAEKCGYTNCNTFFKAFKRYYSMSPSVMRHTVETDENAEP